ncbi:hypothetical protein D3C81_773080 [compost metagenome]
MDLMQQARAGAVVEHRILAGAQLEHLLQDLHAFAHRVGARKRAEVLVLAVRRAPVIGHARELVACQLEKWIRLVVAEQDVVARRQCLDQIVLKQQRLGLGPDHGGIDARDLTHHHRDARRQLGLVEVARDTLFQVTRLTYIKHVAIGVEIAVDARQAGQSRQDRPGIECRDIGGGLGREIHADLGGCIVRSVVRGNRFLLGHRGTRKFGRQGAQRLASL